MSLKGAPELHRRIRAIQGIYKDAGRVWQDEASRYARAHIPVRTGATRGSVRGTFSGTRAKVVGKYTINFIDAGSKAHVEPRQRGLTKTGRVSRRKLGSGKVLKFSAGGQTLFRRKVNKRAIGAHPFKKEAGQAGLQRLGLRTLLYKLWNEAA